ncbi:tyrosine-type recombinase/integrase [Phaeobacter marinintestinus]|uniref:tyrosine-type recombinase/integrase n=1 Tax=Falsiphaeobacter marinintestinus TaxID=1492905 RepID=UPI0011B82992|nr:site-specific integrase [Phaeobacter marinintestinus]
MASVYPARNGKWTAQVNAGGKRRSKTFPTKIEARRWARHLETQIDEGAKPTTNMTFGALTAEYISAISETKEVGRGKISALAVINKLIGRVPVAEIDVALIRDFVTKRRNSETTPGPNTIGMDLTHIQTVLTHGGPLAGVDTSAAIAAVKQARTILSAADAIRPSAERHRRPTDAELITLRDAWAGPRRAVPLWNLTQFAICTAMRLGEICRIRWHDLDADARTVVIRDRKHPRAKAGNNQTVPLLRGPVVIAGETIDPMHLIASMPREADQIFPFDPGSVSTLFTRSVKKAGIDDLRFHDLRHDGVSRLFEAGYQIEQVALVSGHRDWNMLRRYTQLSPEALHRD